jgi:hypothetical protein
MGGGRRNLGIYFEGPTLRSKNFWDKVFVCTQCCLCIFPHITTAASPSFSSPCSLLTTTVNMSDEVYDGAIGIDLGMFDCAGPRLILAQTD